ncbi:MAG: UDP-N-acetylmuramyl pentapeptide phosphotransferase/UDP-N-acetylglucosamine-phosphate transferase [Acidimicrobiales bacterium]|jgi:UDP-GlcNAc:undecaprenyl-phosphate GlcNAc-1-phosphate transferase|nr:UDP-N-acetylmuramyl pentapeptide phosphotransferase/UDP-N-acetylglucosamine-phosphate transferase [Acidimicrobiales bacterium]
MTVLLAAGVGFLAGRLTWVWMRPSFVGPTFERDNYRQKRIPTAAGVALPIALVLVEGGRALAGAFGLLDGHHQGVLNGARAITLLVAVGFGLLGALDDLAGTGDPRGFRGHVASLAGGRLTSGGLKLVGGATLALVVARPAGGATGGRLVADAALIALSANLGNLLDRAPGRILKSSFVAFAALAIVTAFDRRLVGPAVVVGAGLGLILDDLHERVMLGDAGANVLGAVLGLSVVLTGTTTARTACLGIVLALNLLAELVSFSRVIDAVPFFRAIDVLGRRAR